MLWIINGVPIPALHVHCAAGLGFQRGLLGGLLQCSNDVKANNETWLLYISGFAFAEVAQNASKYAGNRIPFMAFQTPETHYG